MNSFKRGLLIILISAQCVSLALPSWAQEGGPGPAPSPEQLRQLVAPIALYPDALVAQILAASTYPTQVVEAVRWLKDNPGLTGNGLAEAAGQQPWDPSVKALTAFPSVLSNMDQNLSWTSALGDAYYNYPQDVFNTIQAMRREAQQAGTLQSNSQQKVIVQGSTVIVEPANPQVVYVPSYNPTSAYGAPVATYPGYSGADLALTGVLAFGAGVLVGSLVSSSDGWGWNNWNTNWHGGNVVYNKNVYVSNTNVYRRNDWNGGNWNGRNWNGNRNNWNGREGNRNTVVNVQNRNNNFNTQNRNFTNNNRNVTNQNRNFTNQNRNVTNQNRNLTQNNRQNTNQNRYGGKNNYRGANNVNWKNNLNSANRTSRGYENRSAPQRGNAFGGMSPGGNAFANSERGRSSFASAQRFGRR